MTNINVGNEVIVCGKVVNYKGNTPDTVGGKAYLYSLNGHGTITGINTAKANAAAQAIYSIDGRRLTKAVKGINIINGKKVIIK